MFWGSTLPELAALFKRHGEQERRELLRHALVAATIMNVHRRPGTSAIQPEDLIRTAPREEDYLTPKQSQFALDKWATSVNADFAQGKKEKKLGDRVDRVEVVDDGRSS